MATVPVSGAANGTALDPKSDLAGLWEDAITDYEKRTGKSLKQASFRSMDEVIQGTEKEVQKFKGFRNDGSKVDKVRTAFKNNLWLIDKVVKTIQVIGSTAAAFPPAMPASLIFSAFGQVMTSFSQVSADYDKVVGFFEFTQRFLDRLSMIEGKTPPMAQFHRCIVRVFSSMLVILAVSQDYAKEHGRFKKWFNTLMAGSDPGLAGAYKDMDSAIKEMSDAVGLATLSTVVVLAQIMKTMEEGVEFVVTKTTFIDERTKVIESKIDIAINQGQIIDSKNDEMLRLQREQREMMKKFLNDRENNRGGHDKTQDSKGRPGQLKGKTDPGENKRVALQQVANWFTHFTPRWNAMSKATKAQRKEICIDLVPKTGKWILDESTYKSWLDHENLVLAVLGAPGIGKSFLAESVIHSFETPSTDRKSFAYFFFEKKRTTYGPSRMHLAETDHTYCEELASEFSEDTSMTTDPWRLFFTERFPAKSNDHVYLIFDGVDEMKEDELKGFYVCLKDMVEQSPNVHVLFTGRPIALDHFSDLKLPTIEVTKTQLAIDIEKVIASSIKKLPRLRKFRKPVRRLIFNKVKAGADGMRYVDHMLRRLSGIGREKAVLDDLEKNLPSSLEDLYELMLRDCQANRTEKQYLTLKKLFAWLAYSKRALTLAEAGELISRTVDDDRTFDIEDEIIGRSARILEIVRNHDGEDDDDADEDGKADESDHADDNIDIVFPDSGRTPLSFQERSLREYFQAVDVDEKGLRTPPSAAHLTIFEMAADLLFEGGEKAIVDEDDPPSLLSYATDFWAQHLQEIDLEKATSEEVNKVVSILSKIWNNHNNIARTFEHYAANAYSEMVSEGGTQLLSLVQGWVRQATSTSCSDLLSPEVQVWAEEFVSSQEPLMVLAHGHVVNWYTQHDGLKNSRSFKFARDAFNLSHIDVSENTPESVLKVSNHFPDIEKTAGSFRGISVALVDEMDFPEESIKYAKQGLEMIQEEKSPLRFFLTRSISMSEAAMSRLEEAVQGVENAFLALPEDWTESAELIKTVKWLYQEKAGYLQFLDRADEAIEAYRSFNEVKPVTHDGYVLDDMTRVWSQQRDPDGTKLLALLHKWDEKERLAWFGYIFEWNDAYAIGRFDQVAALNGEHGKAFLLQCYDHFMATIPTSSDKIIYPQFALANTYRTVIRDDRKAKELYMAILKRDIKDMDIRGSVDGTLFSVRRALAEILFDEFLKSSDPAHKQNLLEEMKNFPNQRNEASDYFQLQGSNISAMVALMTRVVGQASEYQALMQKTFDTCVDGLSDTVGWNDSSSFRLLAKILACMEGLDRDALIAISCQFSKVTEEPDKDEDAKKQQLGDDTKVDEITAAAEENGSKDEPIVDAATVDESAPISGEVNGAEVGLEKEEPHIDAPIHLTQTTISSTTVEDGVLKDSSTVIIEEATVEAVPEVDEQKFEPDTEPIKGEYDDEEKVPLNDDEEIGSAGLSCDGPCGRAWDRWEVPVYFCIFCTNCDICPTCYGKRMAENRGEPTTHWKPFCGDNHRYAKGPIKGWKGVKGGAIRIEGEDGDVEEVKVHDWLKGLKEERWPAAWQKFWKRLDGVNDIGF